MNPRITVPNANLVVPLDDLKSHLNYKHASDKDAYVTSLAYVAQEVAMRILRRAVMLETGFVYELPSFSTKIVLPYPPLVRVNSLTYYNSSNELATGFEGVEFRVYANEEPAVVEMLSTPAAYSRIDAVRFDYTAGYASSGLVPERVKHWIRLKVYDWFTNRGAQIIGTIYSSTKEDEAMLLPMRNFGRT